MENKEELTHFELEMYVGETKAKEIIKEANGRKIFFENTLDYIDGYIITYGTLEKV
jgi:hypothetical protein